MTDTPPITLQLFGAPGADPEADLSLIDPGDWVDFSDRLTSNATWQVGRIGIATETDPAELNILLNNDDGWLTPNNNASPYYPHIDKRSPLPLRLLAAREGDTTVEQVTCFLKSLQLGFDTTGDYAYVSIKAKGRLDWLDRIDAPVVTSTSSTVVTTNPVAFWPLTDGEGATSAASGLVGGASMTKTGSLHFGTGNGGSGQPKILDLAYYTGTAGGLNAAVPAGTSETSWRVECKMTWPDNGAAQGVIGWRTQGTVQFWQLGYYEATSVLRLQYWLADGSGSVTVDSATAPDPGDQLPHTYRITADQSGANIAVVVYVDGVAQITTTATTHTCGRPTRAYINPAANNGSQMPAVGGYTFWAPYTASSVDTEAASTGYPGEAAGDRIARLCEEAGIPVTVGEGATTLMGVQGEGTLLDLLRECEAADGGLLHDGGPYGSLVYQPRSARYNRPVDLTLSITGDHQIADGFSPTMDDRSTVKSLTVNTTDGNSGSYEDTNVRGGQPASISLNLDASEDPAQHAAWRVAIGNNTGLVHDGLPLGDLAVEDALLDAWQASDRVGLRVQTVDPPTQMSPLPLEDFADGYTASCDGFQWLVNLSTTPADPYEVIVLDTSASTLAVAVNSSDTTFTSVVSQAPRWTTTDEPVQLQCGGETPITATAITDVAVAYVAAGAASHADNASVTPALYSGATTGDLICVLCAIRSSGTGTVDVSGYARLVGWANFALFGKIHTGSESNPTVTPTGGSAGDTVSGFTFGLRNTIGDVSHVVLDWADWLNNSAQDIAYPPLGTARLWDGSIILYLGWKQDDWTSVATIASATEILEAPTVTGNDQGIVADYVIQTTAAAIPTGSFTVTGGTSAISRGIVLAIGAGRSTLTVTRATNGTATSHAAGDALQVADTGNLGL